MKYALKPSARLCCLDLSWGLSLPVTRAAMVPAPVKTLFGEPVTDPVRPPVVAAPRVLRTSSALLYGALAGVYTDLGSMFWVMKCSAIS